MHHTVYRWYSDTLYTGGMVHYTVYRWYSDTLYTGGIVIHCIQVV